MVIQRERLMGREVFEAMDLENGQLSAKRWASWNRHEDVPLCICDLASMIGRRNRGSWDGNDLLDLAKRAAVREIFPCFGVTCRDYGRPMA